MKDILVVLFIIVGCIVLAPLGLIWSLNTLFPGLAIHYTFWTWLAALALSAPFANRK